MGKGKGRKERRIVCVKDIQKPEADGARLAVNNSWSSGGRSDMGHLAVGDLMERIGTGVASPFQS